MKRFSFYYYIVLACMITMFANSCVQGDLYELYENDSFQIVRNKKGKDDINFRGTPGRRIFDNTCFMIAACHASSSNDGIDKYIENLDNFMKSKRAVNSPIRDDNREFIVKQIFGDSDTGARNGATDDELLSLLNELTGFNYNFQSLQTSESIKSFIESHRSSNSTQHHLLGMSWTTYSFSEKQYIIKTVVSSSLGHVFNYNGTSNDLGRSTGVWNYSINAPSGSYSGVFYPSSIGEN